MSDLPKGGAAKDGGSLAVQVDAKLKSKASTSR